MDKYLFTLRNDLKELNGEKIGRFDAFFPDVDKFGNGYEKKSIPPYVKIKDIVFKTQRNGGNNSIFIAPGNFDPINKGTPEDVEYFKASKANFFWNKIRNDKSQKWMFWTLLAAIVGVGIDTSFAIGKVHVFIPCTASQMIALLSIAMVLKIIGLFLAFRKGFWESK